MAAIIGPGGPFTAAKNGPGPFFFTIILLPRMVLPGPVIARGAVYGSHNWSGGTILG